MLSQRPKELPPAPLVIAPKGAPPGRNEYSLEAYARLLKQENEQLRLRAQKLIDQIIRLEENLSIQRQHGMASLKKVERYKVELSQRDNMVAEMAEIIINAFQQYKTKLSNPERASHYSHFDDSSSDDIVIGVLKL